MLRDIFNSSFIDSIHEIFDFQRQLLEIKALCLAQSICPSEKIAD